jgi:hypothetical protein
MSATEMLKAAARHGMQVTLEGDNLVLNAATMPPDAVLAAIRAHKAEIVSVLRAAATPAAHPPPRITRDPHFGCDDVPPRYTHAWNDLLSQCPAGVKPFFWETAIYDSAALFGCWGAELARLGWTPGNLFDVPHDDKPGGLVWHLLGERVLALGPERAFTETGVFDRARS